MFELFNRNHPQAGPAVLHDQAVEQEPEALLLSGKDLAVEQEPVGKRRPPRRSGRAILVMTALGWDKCPTADNPA